jgi:hypothetical protein
VAEVRQPRGGKVAGQPLLVVGDLHAEFELKWGANASLS